MEDESMSLINFVPSFARGFNLLLVHDDTVSLVYLSSLLELFSFKVTATSSLSAAASMICDDEGGFKLVMVKANIPGMDALSFIDLVLAKHIPVILVYSGGFDNVTRKALATGLCYILAEPIRSNDLKYVWQHVYHSEASSAKEAQNKDAQDMVCHAKELKNTKMKQVVGANGERNHGAADKGGKLKGKRKVDDEHTMAGSLIATQCDQVHNANGKRKHDDDDDDDKDGGMVKEKRTADENTTQDSLNSAPMNVFDNYYNTVFAEKKRSPSVWTPELHLKFTEALRVIGEKKARPKEILRRMREPHITVRQVASHLQKHKSWLRRIENARNSSDLRAPPVSTTSSLSPKAQTPSPSEVSTTLEGASVDQTQPEAEYDSDIINTLLGDDSADSFDLSENENNAADADRYYEMLKAILEDTSFNP